MTCRLRRAAGPTTPTILSVVVGLSIALVLTTAGPAAAHPFIEGGEVPVDSLARVTLAMAHGCGTEDQGGGDPTTDVSLEVPASVRVVDVPDVDGFDIELEQDAQGRTEIVTWTATTSQELAPELTFDAVVSGEPGSELYLKVFQGCEGFAYRWIGTPDEPAESPAVSVELTAPDPDSPPPEESDEASDDGVDGDAGTANDADDSAADDSAADDSAADDPAADDPAADDPAADDPAADDPAADDAAPGGSAGDAVGDADGDDADDTDAGGQSDDAEAADEDGEAAANSVSDGDGWLVPLLAVVALLAVVGAVLVRRGRRPDTAGE